MLFDTTVKDLRHSMKLDKDQFHSLVNKVMHTTQDRLQKQEQYF